MITNVKFVSIPTADQAARAQILDRAGRLHIDDRSAVRRRALDRTSVGDSATRLVLFKPGRSRIGT